jgi:hypothetical protein
MLRVSPLSSRLHRPEQNPIVVPPLEQRKSSADPPPIPARPPAAEETVGEPSQPPRRCLNEGAHKLYD